MLNLVPRDRAELVVVLAIRLPVGSTHLPKLIVDSLLHLGTVWYIMIRLASSLTISLLLGIASLPTTANAESLKNCKQILAKYPNGVAKNRATAKRVVALGNLRPTIEPKVYAGARKLDKSGRGAVCVTEANKGQALPGLPAPTVTSSNEPAVNGNAAVSSTLSAAVANLGGTCMVAMREGKIIGEWYSGGRTASTKSLAYSSSKPLTAAVIGAAQQLGRLSIEQSIADFIPEFKGTPKAAITIRHLMTHTSGLKATNAEGAAAMRVKAGTLTSASLNLSLTSTPGSTFDYESSILAMQLLVQVVERAVGERFTVFAEKYVLRPAGMANSVYKGDEPATNWDTGDPWLAGGLDTTCRDLARLGQLFQQKGQWAGRQIFTEEFATQATAVQMSNIVFPGGASGNYGFLLNHNWGGIGHAGACGQLVVTMSSGITVASMSSSSLLTPTILPSECSLLRVGPLINATLAVARLNF